MREDTKQFTSLLIGLALIAGILVACEDTLFILDAERVAEYLELTEPQKETFFEQAEQIEQIVRAYYRELETLRERYATMGPSRREWYYLNRYIARMRQEATYRIGDSVEEIESVLTREQRKKFSKVHLPDLALDVRSEEVRRAYRLGPNDRAYVTPTLGTSPPMSDAPRTYKEVLRQWTIVFGPTRARAGLSSARADEATRQGTFPVVVKAMLMDPKVIEAQLRRHDEPEEPPTDAQMDELRNAYYAEHETERYIEVRMELRTLLHKSYLDTDRWIIYLEDDRVNQYEPQRIVEVDALGPEEKEAGEDTIKTRKGKARRKSPTNKKFLELYFPRTDFYGKPIINREVRLLKLVFVALEDRETRAEGAWIFE